MGFISEYKSTLNRGKQHSIFPGADASRAVWQEIFGATNKERGSQKPVVNVPGGSYGRGMVSTAASYARLLEAMRSMAPGGWSDDRWEQTKHFVGIAYVAIHRICTQFQQAEFQVFKKDPHLPEGKRPITRDDPPDPGFDIPPYKLVEVLEKPNKQDSFGKLMYRWFQQKYLTGTALTWLIPNALGTPMELYCVPTAIAIPQPAVNPDYPDGYYRIQPVYPYGPFSSYPTPASAVGAAIPAQWMLRFQYPHPLLRYEGYSPLTGLRLHLDEVESIDRSRWYTMKRASRPDAVLNMDEMEGAQPLPESEIERIRAEFENTFQGPENHGRLYVATPGARLEPWGAIPADMEYQAGWEQLVSFAMGGFGITKPAAGMIEDASYATLFATLKQLHLITLDPECADIGSELTRHLAPYFGQDLIIDVRCKRIDDHDLKNTKLQLAIQAKAIKKNTLLRELELPPTEEAWGEDMCGDPSPFEIEQMQQQQMQQQAMMGGGMPGQAPPGVEGQVSPEEEQAMLEQQAAQEQGAMPTEGEAQDEELAALLQGVPPDESEMASEGTGNLGKGSLGPRKTLPRYEVKSFYEQCRKEMRNGRSPH